jgi:lipopolysaccharide transport system ATP-binding protein
MNQDTVLKVENVSKKFCKSLKRSMAYGSADIARNMFNIPYNSGVLRKGEFWSLKDISFEVKKSESVGFVGKNGSGKSTLLRILNGIYPPDVGKVQIRGKVGALIAVGAGFHPHMTGRENVYLNGAILGMSRKELDQKFDAIAEFAEIGSFLDAPVSTYSSGMTVRLGFSIAVHIDPDIMLVDEILAVGDLEFQLKCLRKLHEFREDGGTYIIVSHNMQAIRNSCDRVVWIEDGRMIKVGKTQEICDLYESSQIRKTMNSESINNGIIKFRGRSVISSVEFDKKKDSKIPELKSGDDLRIKVYYDTKDIIKNPILTIAMKNSEGKVIFENYSNDEIHIKQLRGKGFIEFTAPNFNLRPDIYDITLILSEGNQLNKIEWHDKSYKIQLVPGDARVNQGLIYPNPKWKISNL